MSFVFAVPVNAIWEALKSKIKILYQVMLGVLSAQLCLNCLGKLAG